MNLFFFGYSIASMKLCWFYFSPQAHKNNPLNNQHSKSKRSSQIAASAAITGPSQADI